MYLDFGEIRFFTKVAERSPLGLRPLIFKQKNAEGEKLVFVVKTLAEDIETLALSKMTWQLEKSPTSNLVVVLRLLILPEGSDSFYKSEAGLIIREKKDQKVLELLYLQNSVEIYFFNSENEFHSKIELLTTYNMAASAERFFSDLMLIDESRMIVQSENLSEYDLQQALNDKISEVKVNDKNLADAINRKMPIVSFTNIETKPAEDLKTSIKSDDIFSEKSHATKTSISQDNLNKKTIITPPPKEYSLFESEESEETFDSRVSEEIVDILTSISEGKMTEEQVLKSLSGEEKLTANDLLKSLQNSPEEFDKSEKKEIIYEEEAEKKEEEKISFNENQRYDTNELMRDLMQQPSPLISEKETHNEDLINLSEEFSISEDDLLNALNEGI